MSTLKPKEKLKKERRRSANLQTPQFFHCKICSKKLKGKETLAHHVKIIHAPERPFSCSRCTYTCKRNNDLKSHIRRVHEKLFPHVCIFCDKGFLKMGDLNKHLRTHTREKPHSCLECEESFSERHNLARHIKTTHRKLPLGLKCPGCPKYLANEENYKKHVEKHNFEKKDCGTCGKSCSSEFTLAKHMIRMHSDRLVECEYCSKRFVNQKTLKLHLVYHTGTKSSICHICGKTFFKFELQKHIRTVHEAHKYKCEFCQKTFSSGGNLRMHRARVHIGVPEEVKKFSCPTCGKRFYHEGELRKHEPYHGTDRPFKCDICNNTYKAKMDLNKHKRLHDVTKRKIRFLMCPHCLRGLSSSNALKRHIARVHLGEPPQFSCIFCGATATQKGGLYNHIRRCIGEIPFVCEECDYSTVCKSDLENHFREKHTRERPFKCDPSCGKTYGSKKLFYMHQKFCRIWNS